MLGKQPDWVAYFSKLERDNERLKRALKRAHAKIDELEHRLRKRPHQPKQNDQQMPPPIRNLELIHNKIESSPKKQRHHEHQHKANKSPRNKDNAPLCPPPPPPSKKHAHHRSSDSGKLKRNLFALNIDPSALKPGARKKKKILHQSPTKKVINQKAKIEQAMITKGKRRKRTRKRLSAVDIPHSVAEDTLRLVSHPLFLNEQNEEQMPDNEVEGL